MKPEPMNTENDGFEESGAETEHDRLSAGSDGLEPYYSLDMKGEPLLACCYAQPMRSGGVFARC